jgi:diguanylate cyclase (GGDEF)-like protein
MKFLRKHVLLVSSILVTVLMLIGVVVISHDALMIRNAEEIEEDASKLSLNAEQWLNHQQEIEVAVVNFVLSGRPQNLTAIAGSRQEGQEHLKGMKTVLAEYEEEADAKMQGLMKFWERHQRLIDQIVAQRKAGNINEAERILTSNEYAHFMDGAKLIIESVSRDLQERRGKYNKEVSLSVMRGGISFAVLALLMISVIWISYVITARAQRRSDELAVRLAFEATHDALTGLPNRRYIYEYLGHALDLAKRHKQRLALLVIDLDGFKKINDTLGHNAGDQVLKEVARRFKRASRASDFVVRTGGDEFALVAENIDLVNSLEHLAQRLVQCLAEPIDIADQSKATVGCSIGIAIYPDHANGLDSLFAAGDESMYAAKASGKNCWQMKSTLPGLN